MIPQYDENDNELDDKLIEDVDVHTKMRLQKEEESSLSSDHAN